MNNPLVSVIIPCYMQAQYLDECLDSVLEQTYENWECIIVNDGSMDNTEEVVEKWIAKDARFVYLVQQNLGVSVARNNGVKIAKGEYIQFLDADDLLDKNKIKRQECILETNSTVDIVYGSSRYFFNDNPKELYPIHYAGIIPTVELNKKDKNQREVLLRTNVCTNCAGLYKKKIFQKVFFKSIVFEDWLFHFECVLNDFIFHYENNEESYCFIRMTPQSQMIRHIEENGNVNNFKMEIQNLISEFSFNSKFDSVPNISKNFEKKENSLVKKAVLECTPPILIKLSKKIFFKLLKYGK